MFARFNSLRRRYFDTQSRAVGLTREDVFSAYRLLLNREPESEDTIKNITSQIVGIWDLIKSITLSAEYNLRRNSNSLGEALESHFSAPPQKVDVDVDRESAVRMLDRIKEEWRALGETDPHYSVLSTPNFRADQMNEATLDLFKRSGAVEAGHLSRFEALVGVDSGNGICLEFGCGVGRTTRYLADRFQKVIAVDISPGNLALCRAYMDEEGIKNVDTVQIHDIQDIYDLQKFDVLFSRIVLQHNPPPIQKLILTSLLEKANRFAFFQATTNMPGYRFDAREYLDGKASEIEMHCLPRHVILSIINQCGLHILDVAPDNSIGPMIGSFTFFASR